MNDARDKFDLSTITSEEIEIDRPKRSHKNRFWSIPTFIGAVSQLQIDPLNPNAIGLIDHSNSQIEQFNRDQGYKLGCGKFPLKYFQEKYQHIHSLRTDYHNATDPRRKQELAANFETLCVATLEFCEEHSFPSTWAWKFTNINQEPSWDFSPVNGSGSNAEPGTAAGSGSGAGSNLGPSSAAAAGSASGSGAVPGVTAGSDLEAGPGGDESGAGSGLDAVPGAAAGSNSGVGDDIEMGGAAGPDTDGGAAISESIEKLTLDGEPIISKRQMFKNFQFLVEERSGLRVWKSAQLCADLKPENIHSVKELTKDFITQHKNRYKGICWIAMALNGAVTLGARRYPRISVMVEWLGDLEDTLMSRSDLIRIAGQNQVDRDVYSHLPHRKNLEFEGRSIYVMSQTEPGLFNGEMKAMQQIKSAQFQVAKAVQTMTPQGVLSQPPNFQPGSLYPPVAQPTIVQPGAFQTAIPQPPNSQSGSLQPHFAQPTIVQPTVAQGAFQTAQPNQADMVLQAIINNAVEQAVRQYRQQPTALMTM